MDKAERKAVAKVLLGAASYLMRKEPNLCLGACEAIGAQRGSKLNKRTAGDAAYNLFALDARQNGPRGVWWGANFGACDDWRVRVKLVNNPDLVADPEVAREGRVLMLCFLAAMVEKGDL